MLDAMTATGARSMGLDETLGVLAEGALADVILLELDRVVETPLAKPVNALVYGEDGASVRDVFVAGRPVVRDRVLQTIDEQALKRDVSRWGAEWVEQLGQVERWAELLSPAYDEIYHRCVRTEIGVNRWVGDDGRWLSEGGT
jgi:hypothetical protein